MGGSSYHKCRTCQLLTLADLVGNGFPTARRIRINPIEKMIPMGRDARAMKKNASAKSKKPAVQPIPVKTAVTLRILMIAGENDAIARCKVGGVADVVRDAPRALAVAGCEVIVLTPSYGFLHTMPGAVKSADVPTLRRYEWAEPVLYDCAAKAGAACDGVRNCVIDHPLLHSQTIYVADSPERPFATDATKFAHFCRIVGDAIRAGAFGKVDCLHLHDWQTGFLFVLREFHPDFAFLRGIRTAFTIHNLAYQGVRPLTGDASSLKAWFPDLTDVDWNRRTHGEQRDAVIRDTRWPECVNPMLAAVRLADAVHVVSPTYAEEVLLPNDDAVGRRGGEGLHDDMKKAAAAGRLHGILNGCEYPSDRISPRIDAARLFDSIRDLLPAFFKSAQDQKQPWLPHLTALTRLTNPALIPTAEKLLLTCVTRAASQKVDLMRASTNPAGSEKNGVSSLEAILRELGDKGVLVMISSGERDIEEFLTDLAVRYSNFVFLNGFAASVAESLYASGDIFLMPSSFEPCGIAQMLAMRDGQPVVAHATGGLKDTIRDGTDGFLFDGGNLVEKADNFVAAVRRAVAMKLTAAATWSQIVTNAKAARFEWRTSANEYIAQLYLPLKSGA
jgi:starch synthase